jgi:hypothetical protein
MIESIRMGTTVSTNALLERRGERCALITSKGWGDVLLIGMQGEWDRVGRGVGKWKGRRNIVRENEGSAGRRSTIAKGSEGWVGERRSYISPRRRGRNWRSGRCPKLLALE